MALKKLFVSLSVLILVASCGKDKDIDPSKPPKPEDPKPPVTVTVSKKAQIDSINKLLKTIDRYKDVVRDSIWADSSGVTFFYNYSEQRIPVTPNNLAVSFPGAFVNIKDFKSGKYLALQGYPSKPVWILSDATGTYSLMEEFIPTKTEVDRRVNQLYNGATEISNSAYSIGIIKRFEDGIRGSKEFLTQMKPTLNLKVDTAVKTSRVIIENNSNSNVFQFSDVDAMNQYPDLFKPLAGTGGYIDYVGYGYRISIIVESNEIETKLKDAVEHLLVKKNASNDDIQLLQQAKAYVYYNHPFAASISTENKNGYERLKECEDLLAKPYPKQGVPVYFFAKEIKATNSEDYKPAKTGSLDFSFRGQ